MIDEDTSGQAHARFTVELKKMPPGDASKLFITLGCEQFVGVTRDVDRNELMDRDDDPATTSATAPAIGMSMTVRVPVELVPSVQTTHTPHFGAIATLFWGTDEYGPAHQARAQTSIEALYKRDVGRDPNAPLIPLKEHRGEGPAALPPG